MDDIDLTNLKAVNHPENDSYLQAVIRIGQPAYERLVSQIYPGPCLNHPEDADNKACALIQRIAKLDESILTNNINHKNPFARSRVLFVACRIGGPEYAMSLAGNKS